MTNTFIDRAAADVGTTVERVWIDMADGRIRYTIIFADRTSAEFIVDAGTDWVNLEQAIRTHLSAKQN